MKQQKKDAVVNKLNKCKTQETTYLSLKFMKNSLILEGYRINKNIIIEYDYGKPHREKHIVNLLTYLLINTYKFDFKIYLCI